MSDTQESNLPGGELSKEATIKEYLIVRCKGIAESSTIRNFQIVRFKARKLPEKP